MFAKIRRLPLYGWFGVFLVIVFWFLNWYLDGLRTHWGFFPLWLGYSLFIDALNQARTGTSLATRNVRAFVILFVLSAPSWWLFELLNQRVQNWEYLGRDAFSAIEFSLYTTLSFTTVMPAVFGSAEFVSSFGWIQRFKHGPTIRSHSKNAFTFFCIGLLMLILLLTWPVYFFPFMWLSVFFIFEPINIWLGNVTIARWTNASDWRPVIALWLGALLCGLFWELWNFYSYPKWIYHVPWVDFFRIFEMPLLGYGGYLPFSLELFSLYHLFAGLFGYKNTQYITSGLVSSRGDTNNTNEPNDI
jgi:hypothetical protein